MLRISTPAERQAYLAAVARILDELAGEIELLGAALCADPALVARHLEHLQAFDLITQKQRALGELLRADCPVSALSLIDLEDLKRRVEQIVAAEPQP